MAENPAGAHAITAFYHVAMSTPDIDRLVAFYCDNFGGEVLWHYDWENEAMNDRVIGLSNIAARSVTLRICGMNLELFQFSRPEPRPRDPDYPANDHGLTHIAFGVADIHATYAKLLAAGARFHCEPQQSGPDTWVTYGRDPDGNIFELIQAPADAAAPG